ncbi:amino acid ABC transporter substrate-binding protein [Campylobacter gracilis]|uniref:ABC transporter, substrate-binding protein, family 3 n=1 Tax=Campylobacter gracilis RM3268 TaxID=553220 RepID=C8PHT5_9BACT|nr:amino acid ABC transporter substrate-binding protein [Campylobacter gracilis]AKT93236.1 amino acid ABC transporter, periplasmic cysteine-binding protein [Campylobacter gracilis]EEV17699.1 ABC transporter, substrate-binding protein, family 3 [Campylobacter gracilis RM3268]UEB44602.1 amino acid ABC transporter substrate-binding protein [Campylobacter gracilis]SUW78436.1 solute-binding family 1 protein [Campylobacter gracilis]
MKNLIKTLLACALLICGANSKTLREGVLKVATEGTFSPFSYYNDKNELVGYDVDVARAVAEKLGLKIEFLTAPWDAMLAAFDAGKADAVFNQVSITDERKKKYEYSVPYTVVYGAIIVHKDNNDIKSFEDLKGKKNADSATSNWAQVAKKYGAQNVTVDSFAKSMELLIARRVDTVVRDNTVFYDFLKQRPDAPIKIAAKLKDVDYSAAIVQKGNKELADQINKALNELKAEGKLKEISLKYFGKDVSE